MIGVVNAELDQLTVRTRVLLVPPLEQPRLPLLPAGVCTATLKLPGAGIIDDVMVTVSWELLFTTVARATPLKTTTEEETKSPPVAESAKLGGNCEKVIVVGEIELSVGAGRELPQRGFRALHPVRSRSATKSEMRQPIRDEDAMNRRYAHLRLVCTHFGNQCGPH
jgi:hypothetical protein